MILVCGFVKFQERVSRPFQQNFMITAQGDKWKIVSDCFRLQEPVMYVYNRDRYMLVTVVHDMCCESPSTMLSSLQRNLVGSYEEE